MNRARSSFALVCLALASLAGCVPDGERPRSERGAAGFPLARILEAEDARPAAGPDLDALIAGAGAGAEDARLRRTAVRALGRLENAALISDIEPHLGDIDPGVRAAAVEALGQAVHGRDGSTVLTRLLARVEMEPDPSARGALARSMGRLTLEAADRRRAAEALARLAGADGLVGAPETLLGVALGFEALLRGSGNGPDRDGLDRAAADRLEAMAAFRADSGDDVDAARIRALAVASLGRARRLGVAVVERAAADLDPEVRRAPLPFLGALAPSQRPAILERALGDPSPRVAIDALRIVAAGPRTSESCAQLFQAAAPPSAPAVRVVALEALGRPCPDAREQRDLLRRTAAELPAGDSAVWQPAAQALLSLARIDKNNTTALLPRFVTHESPFVRARAATVAGLVEAEAHLQALAADVSPNVRVPALEALFAARGHGIDGLLLDQLESDDTQLLVTVARPLEGSPGRTAVAAALMVRFERLSSARRETWRDPRRSLLERIGELGGASLADRVRPLSSRTTMRRSQHMLLSSSERGASRTPHPRPSRSLARPYPRPLSWRRSPKAPCCCTCAAVARSWSSSSRISRRGTRGAS